MTSAIQERADAANDSYANRSQSDVDRHAEVHLDNKLYQVFGYANDPTSGLHATAYKSAAAPYEVIIAYRGTDPGLFSGKTGAEKRDHALTTVQDIAVDATMVRDTVNPQKSAADAFTAEMIDKAAKQGIPKDHVFTAGHSLGGTLAEIEAAKHGLTGSTYNAYGAMGLTDGPPQPGTHLTNYRMAGDVVSAANPHVGQVVSLASQDDVQSARAGRYLDAPAGAPPPNVLITMRLGDHGGQQHFGSKSPDNLLEPHRFQESAQRYADHKVAFDHYSGDVAHERGELAEALKQMQNGYGPRGLPPDVQRQVNEYLTLNVDQPVRHAIEQSGAAQGTEHGLQSGADAARAGGHYVQTQDERVAAAARQAGNFAAPFNPLAPLAGLAVGEAAHLHGEAADATGRFVGSQFETAKGAVEQGAHRIAQAAVGVIHNPGVQAEAANLVNHFVNTYHDAQTAAHDVAQTYDAAKQTVSHSIEATEHAATQAYDTLTHPVQSFESAVASEISSKMSPAVDPVRHQQRALHGESSQVDRAQEAQRQQETQGHTAAREAPLPPTHAAIPPSMRAPERERSVRPHAPSAASHSQEAQTSSPARPAPATTTTAEPNHAALAAQQAHQQAMHAQRQAQHERQPHEERSASPSRAAPSLAPGRAAETAALSSAAAPSLRAAATAAPAVVAPVAAASLHADRAPAQAPSRTDPQAPTPNRPETQRPDPGHVAASPAHTAGMASPAAHQVANDPAPPARQAAETVAATPHAAPTRAAPVLSPPLDPPSMRDFRHAEHPLNPRYQMFRDALGEQGFHAVGRPTLNSVPEIRGYSAEQKDRLAAGFTAQLGADQRYSTEIQHFGKDGDTLLAVEHPRELGAPPLVLTIPAAQTLARTPAEHAAGWRARELHEPRAVNTARPDPQTLSPDHPGHLDHPRHAMFEHAREALSGEYARWGMQKGAEPLDRETMQVVTAARAQRMDDVGAIRLGKGSPDGRIGEYPKLAVYDTPRGPEQHAFPAIVQSQTLQHAPPVQQTTQQFQAVDQQATMQTQQMQQAQAQANAQAPQGPMLGGPGMGR
jgi:hypothetical protein